MLVLQRLRVLKIRWTLSTILKSSKGVWSNVFWYVKACIFWKCIQYTIHWDKTNFKKDFPKMPCFFFREHQLITVLFLICHSYMIRNTRLVSQKLYVEFSIFNSTLFLLKFIFFDSTKCMDSLTLKLRNSLQI